MENGNGRIEALKKRQAEISAQLAAEHMKRRRRLQKEDTRLFRVVGAALCGYVAQNSDGFGLMLRQVLDTAITDSKEREFLRRKGML